jgi:hypothetical protein
MPPVAEEIWPASFRGRSNERLALRPRTSSKSISWFEEGDYHCGRRLFCGEEAIAAWEERTRLGSILDGALSTGSTQTIICTEIPF